MDTHEHVPALNFLKQQSYCSQHILPCILILSVFSFSGRSKERSAHTSNTASRILFVLLLQDEVVKTWGPARAIRDVEDEELMDFFVGMSPWQVIKLVETWRILMDELWKVCLQLLHSIVGPCLPGQIEYSSCQIPVALLAFGHVELQMVVFSCDVIVSFWIALEQEGFRQS